MQKTGRNEPCPCGSGKKYKHCCWGEPENVILAKQVKNNLAKMWSYEKVDMMSDMEIIAKLKEMNIPFENERFLADVRTFPTADGIAEDWFNTYDVAVEGYYDEDFPSFAAWVLWDRLAAEENWSMEKISTWFEKGNDAHSERNAKETCDAWLTAWDALKQYNPPESKQMDYLDELYSNDYSVREILPEIGYELLNAGLSDPSYYHKAISYCTEFLTLFPEEDENTLVNMSRNLADAYLQLGDRPQAEAGFKSIIKDYPANPWGYVGYGDMFYFQKPADLEKAREIYEKGLTNTAPFDRDRDALEERLEMLENESE